MKILLLVFAILIFAVSLPFLMSQINLFQTESFTDTQTSITTAAAVHTANVSLTLPLFGDKLTNVTSITSSITEDATTLTPSAYDSYSKSLTVNGLAEDTARSLTVTYKIDALTNVNGLGTIVNYWPFILVVGGAFFLISKVMKRG